MKFLSVFVLLFLLSCTSSLPQKTVILTFDDSVKSQVQFVAPLLKKYGFNATFFITEGFSFKTNKELYMTWEEIKKLNDQGFEIGNHTEKHQSVKKQNEQQFVESLTFIEAQCEKYGIPRPVSFCYPGYATSEMALKVLESKGYKFARAGGQSASTAMDNPLLLPQAFDGKPESTFEQFKLAVDQADAHHIPILTFHGVPDIEHPWVNTDQSKFLEYMNYLKQHNFKVIALRDYPQN
jgi:peptidoglycan-N-acetylglucosamine deacetylase